MKKQPTEEQKQAAEARREKFRGLCKRIASMSDVERAEIVERAGAVVTCEGHPLSYGNTMLLFLQVPGVSVVGGFRQWKKAGRFVKKGERGASIWIPRGSKSESPAGPGAELSQREIVEASEVPGAVEGGQGARRRFLLGTVFDISQTQEAGSEAADTEQGEAEETAPACPCESVAPIVAPSVLRLLPAPSKEVPVESFNLPSGALPPVAVLVASSTIGPCVAPVDVLPPERVRTIWDSPDGKGGPLLICAPPDHKRRGTVASGVAASNKKNGFPDNGDLFSLSTSIVESGGR